MVYNVKELMLDIEQLILMNRKTTAVLMGDIWRAGEPLNACQGRSGSVLEARGARLMAWRWNCSSSTVRTLFVSFGIFAAVVILRSNILFLPLIVRTASRVSVRLLLLGSRSNFFVPAAPVSPPADPANAAPPS